MRYRPLGKTGLQVSTLGFGASPLGGVFGAIDEEEAILAVREAVEQGINFFDVAPYYGLTKAETVLGNALREVPRDRYLLATKVGRYGATEFDFSAARAVRSVEESLRRLQVEYVDLIQCHDIEFGSLDQIISETIPALRSLQQQGKVRYLGISGLPLTPFRRVLESAEVDTVLSYCHYTLADTALEGLLPFLQEKGVGILNAAPLAMGLLTERNLPEWHPAPPLLRDACARAAAHCRRQGVDIAQLALQFAVANPHIAITLVGMADRETLRKNLAWIEQPMDRELLGEARALLASVHNLTWPSGRPENNP